LWWIIHSISMRQYEEPNTQHDYKQRYTQTRCKTSKSNITNTQHKQTRFIYLSPFGAYVSRSFPLYNLDCSQFFASSVSITFAIALGSATLDHLSTTCPCLSIKNFSKFHLIRFIPKLLFLDFNQL